MVRQRNVERRMPERLKGLDVTQLSAGTGVVFYNDGEWRMGTVGNDEAKQQDEKIILDLELLGAVELHVPPTIIRHKLADQIRVDNKLYSVEDIYPSPDGGVEYKLVNTTDNTDVLEHVNQEVVDSLIDSTDAEKKVENLLTQVDAVSTKKQKELIQQITEMQKKVADVADKLKHKEQWSELDRDQFAQFRNQIRTLKQELDATSARFDDGLAGAKDFDTENKDAKIQKEVATALATFVGMDDLSLLNRFRKMEADPTDPPHADILIKEIQKRRQKLATEAGLPIAIATGAADFERSVESNRRVDAVAGMSKLFEATEYTIRAELDSDIEAKQESVNTFAEVIVEERSKYAEVIAKEQAKASFEGSHSIEENKDVEANPDIKQLVEKINAKQRRIKEKESEIKETEEEIVAFKNEKKSIERKKRSVERQKSAKDREIKKLQLQVKALDEREIKHIKKELRLIDNDAKAHTNRAFDEATRTYNREKRAHETWVSGGRSGTEPDRPGRKPNRKNFQLPDAERQQYIDAQNAAEGRLHGFETQKNDIIRNVDLIRQEIIDFGTDIDHIDADKDSKDTEIDGKETHIRILNREIRETKRELSELEDQKVEKTSQILKDHGEEVGRLKKENSTEVAGLEKAHAEKIAGLEKAHNKKIAKLVKDKDNRVAELEALKKEKESLNDDIVFEQIAHKFKATYDAGTADEHVTLLWEEVSKRRKEVAVQSGVGVDFGYGTDIEQIDFDKISAKILQEVLAEWKSEKKQVSEYDTHSVRIMKEVLAEWRENEVAKFDFDAEKEELSAKVASLKENVAAVGEDGLENAFHAVAQEVAQLKKENPNVEEDILKAWKKLHSVEVDLYSLELKNTGSEFETPEREVDVPIEIMHEILEANITSAQDLMSEAYDAVMQGREMNAMKLQAFIENMNVTSSQRAVLRQHGIRNWDTFKGLWRKELGDMFGEQLQKNAEAEMKSYMMRTIDQLTDTQMFELGKKMSNIWQFSNMRGMIKASGAKVAMRAAILGSVGFGTGALMRLLPGVSDEVKMGAVGGAVGAAKVFTNKLFGKYGGRNKEMEQVQQSAQERKMALVKDKLMARTFDTNNQNGILEFTTRAAGFNLSATFSTIIKKISGRNFPTRDMGQVSLDEHGRTIYDESTQKAIHESGYDIEEHEKRKMQFGVAIAEMHHKGNAADIELADVPFSVRWGRKFRDAFSGRTSTRVGEKGYPAEAAKTDEEMEEKEVSTTRQLVVTAGIGAAFGALFGSGRAAAVGGAVGYAAGLERAYSAEKSEADVKAEKILDDLVNRFYERRFDINTNERTTYAPDSASEQELEEMIGLMQAALKGNEINSDKFAQLSEGTKSNKKRFKKFVASLSDISGFLKRNEMRRTQIEQLVREEMRALEYSRAIQKMHNISEMVTAEKSSKPLMKSLETWAKRHAKAVLYGTLGAAVAYGIGIGTREAVADALSEDVDAVDEDSIAAVEDQEPVPTKEPYVERIVRPQDEMLMDEGRRALEETIEPVEDIKPEPSPNPQIDSNLEKEPELVVPEIQEQTPEAVRVITTEKQNLIKSGNGAIHALNRFDEGGRYSVLGDVDKTGWTDEQTSAWDKMQADPKAFKAWKMDQLKEMGYEWKGGKLGHPFGVRKGDEMRLVWDDAEKEWDARFMRYEYNEDGTPKLDAEGNKIDRFKGRIHSKLLYKGDSPTAKAVEKESAADVKSFVDELNDGRKHVPDLGETRPQLDTRAQIVLDEKIRAMVPEGTNALDAKVVLKGLAADVTLDNGDVLRVYPERVVEFHGSGPTTEAVDVWKLHEWNENLDARIEDVEGYVAEEKSQDIKNQFYEDYFDGTDAAVADAVASTAEPTEIIAGSGGSADAAPGVVNTNSESAFGVNDVAVAAEEIRAEVGDSNPDEDSVPEEVAAGETEKVTEPVEKAEVSGDIISQEYYDEVVAQVQANLLDKVHSISFSSDGLRETFTAELLNKINNLDSDNFKDVFSPDFDQSAESLESALINSDAIDIDSKVVLGKIGPEGFITAGMLPNEAGSGIIKFMNEGVETVVSMKDGVFLFDQQSGLQYMSNEDGELTSVSLDDLRSGNIATSGGTIAQVN